MTSKLATLRQAALNLRLNLFRSLPWGERVAHVLSVLASGTTDAFDQALAQALKRQGMDTPVRGLGQKIYNGLSRKFYSDRDAVENAMIDVVVEISNGKIRIDPNQSLPSFLRTVVQNRVISEMRRTKLERQQSQSLYDTEDPIDFDPEDASALRSFEDLMDASDMRDLKRKLDSVVDWGGEYLEMLLDGYTDKEIIGDRDRGVPSLLAQKMHQDYLTNPSGQPMTMGMWSKTNGWKEKLRRVIEQHLNEAR